MICRAILTTLKQHEDLGTKIVAQVIQEHGVSQKLRQHLVEYLSHANAQITQAKAEIMFYLEMLEYEIHDDY